jgi:cytochrome P450
VWRGFEGNMQPLFLGFLPSVIARPAVANRNRFQDALIKYYRNRYEDGEDVAEITRVRSHVLRKHGLNDADELARGEMGLIFVATTNTIPTLYWFFVNIWLRPELVEALREETSLLVRRKGDNVKEATVDISQLEENCPLLVSCYREAIRLGNQVMGNRRVLRDTVITDHENDGRSYLLKEGTDVIWSAKALHRAQGTWGEDASEFKPDRFLPRKEGEDDKKMKQHYIPFGGGKHLCPGRNFAFAENLGFMCAMLLGFEVEGLKQENVRMGWARFGEGVAKPPEGFQGGSITIRRREGWEDVKWGFVC